MESLRGKDGRHGQEHRSKENEDSLKASHAGIDTKVAAAEREKKTKA